MSRDSWSTAVWVLAFVTLAGCSEDSKGDWMSWDTSREDTSIPHTDESDTGNTDSIHSEVPTFALALSDAKFIGERIEGLAGVGVHSAGDLDGDALPDVLIAAFGGGAAAYGVLSPKSGWVSLDEADVRLVVSDPLDFYWIRDQSPFTSVGDTDGDGYPDLLLGAMGLGEFYTGGAILVLGPALGQRSLPEEGDALLTGSEENDGAGSAVAGPGDTDGDGFEDLVIGGYAHDVPGLISSVGACASESSDSSYVQEDEEEYGLSVGVVWLVLGPVSGEGWLGEAHATLLGEDAGDGAGQQAGRVGDLDGDGLPDLLASSPTNCEGGYNSGAAYVVLSPVSGTMSLADADLKVVGAGTDDWLGGELSDSGDVNGDGSPDLLVGANGPGEGGSGWLVLGPATGHLSVEEAAAHFGPVSDGEPGVTALGVAGDVDGDGFEDLLFGYDLYDGVGDNAGAAWLFYGPVSGDQPMSQAALALTGEAGSGVGSALGTAGDTDADGLADILVGASYDDEGGEDAGAAFLVLGSTLGAL